ncbi:agglutinin biogenesis protein MshP [Aquabacterium sp.]|uniref:agglutinin biogenesis protein MshP n=1 Tax=Aquabacterium sp. TaxID=1872578 RepID=UPI0040376C45
MKQRQQSGFALITAIIILVVLAGLGAFASSFIPMQQLGSAADIQGARTLLAARSGLEWGAYQVAQGGPSCVASTSNTLPATASSLQGITVTVTCDSTKAPLYKVTATACNQPSGGACPNTTTINVSYVERQVEMIVQYP